MAARAPSYGVVINTVAGIGRFSFVMIAGIVSRKPEYRSRLWTWLPNVVCGAMGIIHFRRRPRK